MRYLIIPFFVMCFMMLPHTCIAAPPTLTTPTTENVGANMATLVLQSSGTGIGYFTLLAGNNAACGTGDQVAAGQTSGGAPAPYHGSLPLTAGTAGHYTVRNLPQNTPYTVCFTADSPSPWGGQNLQQIPVTSNLVSASSAALANSWSKVGIAGFSTGQADYTSLTFAPDGTPYVAFSDTTQSKKATVMMFSGGTWISVGNAGFSAGQADYTSLAFAPNGTPYVAFSDVANGHKATVMMFSGGTWNIAGSAGFSVGQADYTSLAFAPDGTPYVAYQDSYKATVMKYTNGTWNVVGSAGFSDSDSDGSISLAFAPDGTPYVMLKDGAGSIEVAKFSNGAWHALNLIYGDDMTLSCLFPSLAITQEGTPLVAYSYFYHDMYTVDAKTVVVKYNNDSSYWDYVGDRLSYSNDSYISLAIAPDGAPYVAYQDAYNSQRATVKKFSSGGWTTVGNFGMSEGAISYTSLAFNPNGIPYVAYQDGGNSNKVTVMKLDTKIDTATALTSNFNPSLYGQTILTATVSPVAASGTVTFMEDATILGSAALSGGSANLALPALSKGPHSITAHYEGSINCNGSLSPVLVQTVTTGTSLTTLSSSLNPSANGLPVTITATVSPVSATGTVTFTDGAASLGTATVTGGVATYSTSALGFGNHAITAVYSGDSNLTGSTSPLLNQTVLAQPPFMGLAPPAVENVGASAATLVLESSGTGTGYFTLLAGSSAVCGSGTQIAAGKTNTGAAALYHGSLPLVAYVPNHYTVRNLTHNTPYTVCFTADSPTGLNLRSSPARSTFSTVAANNLTGANWGVAGNAGFSAGPFSGASWAFAPDGTPHVGYQDTGNGQKATVMKLSNGTWSEVGTPGFSAGTAGSVSLAFAPDGTLHLAFSDGSSGGKATVMKYDGTWNLVGIQGFSAGTAVSTSLAFAPDGSPWVAFRDGNNSNKATVMKFGAGAWSVVGTPGFSANPADYTALAFAPDGTPYMVYTETASNPLSGYNDQIATIMKYIGSAWSVVDVVLPGPSDVSPSYINPSHSFAIGPDNSLFLAYFNSRAADLWKYNNGNLSVIGHYDVSMPYADSFINNNTLSIAPDGSPYVAYERYYFHRSSSQWSEVVNYSGGVNFVGNQIGGYQPTLAFSPDGALYVAFQDVSNQNIINKTTVMKLVTKNTTTMVSSDVNPTMPGQIVTFTATILPASVTGTVTFKDGATTLGTATLANGAATISTSLGLGSHSITAVYAGDTNNNTSTSAPLIQSVGTVYTITALNVDISPSLTGQSVAFIATVFPASATGTVIFMDGATILGSVPLANGAATYATSALIAGSHSMTAVYSGDSNYSGATSRVLTHTVNKRATTTSLSTNHNPATYGNTVTFTATVSPATATGSITFIDGATTLGTATIANGVATHVTSALVSGFHSITAVYGGDSNCSGSSGLLKQTVIDANAKQLSIFVSDIGNEQVRIDSNPPGAMATITCLGGLCQPSLFPFNSALTLTPVPDSYSFFTAWDNEDNECAGSTACTITMSTNKSFTATFKRAPVVNVTTQTPYLSISAALSTAQANDEIRMLDVQQTGPVTLNTGILLNGGWAESYQSKSGLPTALTGGVTVQSGASTAETVLVKGILAVKGGSLRVDGVIVMPQ